jgi:hypothetical protein
MTAPPATAVFFYHEISADSGIRTYNSKSMDTESILQELTQQRDRVVAAIDALNGGGTRKASSSKPGKSRGKMSEAGKRRISERMKARWAKAKRAGKNAL